MACFELAKLYQALGLANMEPKFTERAVQLYGQLVEDYAPSLLASQAQQSLKTIKPGR